MQARPSRARSRIATPSARDCGSGAPARAARNAQSQGCGPSAAGLDARLELERNGEVRTARGASPRAPGAGVRRSSGERARTRLERAGHHPRVDRGPGDDPSRYEPARRPRRQRRIPRSTALAGLSSSTPSQTLADAGCQARLGARGRAPGPDRFGRPPRCVRSTVGGIESAVPLNRNASGIDHREAQSSRADRAAFALRRGSAPSIRRDT